MATALVQTTVCDICGKPATETLNFKDAGKSYQLDICVADLRDLMNKAHTPRRGRRPGSSSKATAARKPARKKPAARKKRSQAPTKTAVRKPARKKRVSRKT
jgi:hypothetical protein